MFILVIHYDDHCEVHPGVGIAKQQNIYDNEGQRSK
jgi:hypothetical protein